jgi:hypothetical protein
MPNSPLAFSGDPELRDGNQPAGSLSSLAIATKLPMAAMRKE